MSQQTLIINSWVHSHEEDTNGLKVFRPSSFRFPLSRGRESIDLLEGGRLAVTGPGSDDRLVNGTGSWHLNGNKLELDQQKGNAVFDIESLSPDRLVFRKATP